jgi:hypothetical protein
MSQLNLYDLVPPARSAPDNALWKEYRIEGSVDGANWTEIEPNHILPKPVLDAAKPPTYMFSTDNADAAQLYFRVVWRDENAVEVATPAMLRPQPLPPWTPTLSDVAAHIPSRTKVGNGVMIGTFTNETKPATADIVSLIITKGVKRVRKLFPDPILDASTAEVAHDLAALYSAMLVELGLFPEQIGNEQSPYVHLKELWDDATGSGEAGTGQEDADNLLGNSGAAWRFERRAPLRW